LFYLNKKMNQNKKYLFMATFLLASSIFLRVLITRADDGGGDDGSSSYVSDDPNAYVPYEAPSDSGGSSSYVSDDPNAYVPYTPPSDTPAPPPGFSPPSPEQQASGGVDPSQVTLPSEYQNNTLTNNPYNDYTPYTPPGSSKCNSSVRISK